MTEITRQVLESALRMRGAEMIPLMSYLREGRREILEQLSMAPAGNTQILQGRAQELKKILDLIDEASALIEKQ